MPDEQLQELKPFIHSGAHLQPIGVSHKLLIDQFSGSWIRPSQDRQQLCKLPPAPSPAHLRGRAPVPAQGASSAWNPPKTCSPWTVAPRRAQGYSCFLSSFPFLYLGFGVLRVFYCWWLFFFSVLMVQTGKWHARGKGRRKKNISMANPHPSLPLRGFRRGREWFAERFPGKLSQEMFSKKKKKKIW